MLKRPIFLFVIILLFLSGCASATQESVYESLDLKIKLTMTDPGTVSISAGLHNGGRFEYLGEDENSGTLTILDGKGDNRVVGEIESFGQIGADETFYPLTYGLTVEPGTYQVIFSAQDKPPLEMQFEIVDEDGSLYLYAPQEYIDPFTAFTKSN